MKKLYLFGLVALLLVSGVVSAHNEEPPVVDCGEGWIFNPFGGYCEADELQPVVDDLQDGINHNSHVNNVQWHVIGEVSDEVDAAQTTAEQALNREDKTGISWGRVYEYLYSDYLDHLKGLFAPLSLVQRVEALEKQADLYDLKLEYLSRGYKNIYTKGGVTYATSPAGHVVRIN